MCLLENRSFLRRLICFTPVAAAACDMFRMASFGNIAEQCLENTVTNIIHEAFRQEFNITARPRLVALPPRPPSADTK